MNPAPTSDRRQRLLRFARNDKEARNDSWDLRAPFHLRVHKVLVFQLDATDRAGDRFSRRGREDFVLLQHSTADVVEVTAGIFFIYVPACIFFDPRAACLRFLLHDFTEEEW